MTQRGHFEDDLEGWQRKQFHQTVDERDKCKQFYKTKTPILTHSVLVNKEFLALFGTG